MNDILEEIQNTICETDFEGEFVSLKVRKDQVGRLIIETETCEPLPPFTVGFQDPVRRRFTVTPSNEVVVEIHDGDEWISVSDFS
jgi:hypothetical protein